MCVSKRRLCAASFALVFAALSLCGCAISKTQNEPADVLTTTAPLSEELTTTQPQSDADENENENLEIDTYIILNDDATAIKGDGASYENGRLTVSAPGVYSVKGKLTDGQIFVSTDDESAKVKLYFDGVEIYCSTSAPVYVDNSPKETQIILAKGSENKLSDNADRTMTDEQADDKDFATAVVYSKDDLQIEGAGALTIAANFNKGIFSRDDLQIRGGTLTITAADDGIRGKDSVEISGGTLNITAGGDGIRTSNEEKGDISISGGDISVISTLDSVQAVGSVAISGGTLRLQSGGGYQEALASQGNGEGTFGGFGFGERKADSSSEDTGSVSAKGIKADGSIAVSGGTFRLNCLDDALHADENVAISGGMFRINTNDDGIHAGQALSIAGGEILIEASYEGLESNTIDVAGGTLDITAQDDGFNAASPDDQNDMTFFRGAPDAQSGQNGETAQPQAPDGTQPANDPPTGELSFGGPQGGGNPPANNGQTPDGENAQGGFGFRRQGGGNAGGRGGMDRADESCVITISGGTIRVNASGDGIDSNSSIRMSGGNVLVLGPTNSGNGALDYAGTCVVTGGSLCTLGSAGMAQGVSNGSIASITAQVQLAAGDTVTVADSSGSTLYQVKSEKQASHFVLADTSLVSGRSYTLAVNGTAAGTCTAQ